MGDARDQYLVPSFNVSHSGSGLGDGADRLVARNALVGNRGNVALEDVQVRAADGGVYLDIASVALFTLGSSFDSRCLFAGP
jgi:hypothetical protein